MTMPEPATERPDPDQARRRRIAEQAAQTHLPPPWTLRMWDGMTLRRGLDLLRGGRMRLSPGRLYIAYFLVLLGMLNSVAARIQRAWYGPRLARTDLAGPPLVVIGHWRSGTTLLHELLVLDQRFGYPTSFQAFAPEHFLVTRHLAPVIRRFMPRRRPMDDMALDLDVPQEDEFALLAMGVPSPYRFLAFPNEPAPDRDYLDFRGVGNAERRRWTESLAWFLRAVTFASGRPLVLKNPVHLGRVGVLLELHPDTRFVHIVRDPVPVFSSTVRLWMALRDHDGFQDPRGEVDEEGVFEAFERLYAAFERDRPRIPAGQLAEVRFEDLLADPVGEMRRVYEELALGGFEDVRPAIEAYFAGRRDYRAARYSRDPDLEATIWRRWGPWMARYGYRPEAVPGDAAAGPGA